MSFNRLGLFAVNSVLSSVSASDHFHPEVMTMASIRYTGHAGFTVEHRSLNVTVSDPAAAALQPRLADIGPPRDIPALTCDR